jgi:hypothetical protein
MDQNTEAGMALFNQCLVILSNLSATNLDGRKEILRFKTLELLC